MRSYKKIYQNGSVYFANEGEVFGEGTTVIWAVGIGRKQALVDFLNHNVNTFINYTYLGSDPSMGVPLYSIIEQFPVPMFTFTDYQFHPKN